MRFDIRYRMHFAYEQPVSRAHNEVRVRPQDNTYQQVLSYGLTSTPPARVLSARDYWGNTVEHLGLRLAHTECTFVAEASVETKPRPSPPAAKLTGAGVEPAVKPVRPADPAAVDAQLADPAVTEEHQEFLVPSPHVVTNEYLSAMAAESVAGLGEVAPRVEGVVARARGLLRYEQGTTDIGISLTDLALGGVGVCQDFAHLTVGMLRDVGIPARYASGYLFAADEANLADAVNLAEGADSGGTAAITGTGNATVDDASSGSVGGGAGNGRSSGDGAGSGAAGSEATSTVQPVRVQTHAWVEAFVPGFGWWGVDPTNGTAVGERHVLIGHGRDYGDVPPVRGVYMGAATAEVEAEVVIARHAPLRAATLSEPYIRPQVIGHRQVHAVRAAQQQQQQ